jgi:hypothetical protein
MLTIKQHNKSRSPSSKSNENSDSQQINVSNVNNTLSEIISPNSFAKSSFSLTTYKKFNINSLIKTVITSNLNKSSTSNEKKDFENTKNMKNHPQINPSDGEQLQHFNHDQITYMNNILAQIGV